MTDKIRLRISTPRRVFWTYNEEWAIWHFDQGSEITITHNNSIKIENVTINRPEEEQLTSEEQIKDNIGQRYRVVYTVADMPDEYFYGRGTCTIWM